MSRLKPGRYRGKPGSRTKTKAKAVSSNGWTSRQQGIYRALVTAAWLRQSAGTEPGTLGTAAKDSWYRLTLHRELGIYTTKQVGQNGFAGACAVFEKIVGKETYWQERAIGGEHAEEKRRYLHEIAALYGMVPGLDEDYARAIAKHALRLDALPLLGGLDGPKLLVVLRALKMHAARQTGGAEG